MRRGSWSASHVVTKTNGKATLPYFSLTKEVNQNESCSIRSEYATTKPTERRRLFDRYGCSTRGCIRWRRELRERRKEGCSAIGTLVQRGREQVGFVEKRQTSGLVFARYEQKHNDCSTPQQRRGDSLLCG